MTKLTILSAALILMSTADSFADDETARLLADQLRLQGYPCEKPKSAELVSSASTGAEKVWTVTCEGASYRMHIVPDMAAKVEKLGG